MSSFIVINEIEELLNDMNDGLTSTLSTISSNVNTIKTDVASILTNTNATTTENSSGVISAKLSYLINRRTRVITPSSTNIKTLNSSDVTLKITEKAYGKSVSTSTWTSTVKQPGVYRFYATASLSVDTNYSDNSDTSSPNTVTLYIDVVKQDGSKFNDSIVICQKGTKGSVGSTTVTKDIGLATGEVVSCYVKLYAYGMSHACGSMYNDLCTATIGNVSIRGTVNETNGVLS